MAKLPGLRPLEERPRYSGTANRGRVRTPSASQMRLPGLNPTASPVDTYARPEQPVAGANGWADLASALASVNPAIQQFLKDQAEPQDSVAEIQKAKLTMSPEQFNTAVRDGSLPGLKSAASFKLVGQDRGFDFLTKLEADMASFDPASQNFDQFYRERLAEYSQGLPQDRMFQSNFYNTVYKGVETLRQKTTLAAGQAQAEALKASQMNVWAGRLKMLDDEGATGLTKAQAIYGDFDANARIRGLSFPEQQEMAFLLAERLVTQGDTETARAMIEMERQSGPYKGSLMTDPKFAARATDLMSRIQTYETQVMENMRIESAETALKTDLQVRGDAGGLYALTDVDLPAKNGGTKRFTVDQQQKMWSEDYLSRSAEMAQRLGESADQTRTRELAVFAQNGVKHTQWEQALKAGYVAGGTSSSSDKATRPPALEDGWKTYQWVHSQNPQYLGTLLDQKTLEYYEAIRIGMESHGDIDRAYLNAQLATSDPDGSIARNRAAREREVMEAVQGMSWFGSYANQGEIEDETKRLADFYMRLGLTGSNAVQEAISTIEKSYTDINGSLIKTNGQQIPPQFSELVGELITDYATKHGEEEGIDASDITIRQQAPGLWVMVNKSNALNPLWNPSDRVISLSRLRQWQETKKSKKAGELADTISSR